MGLEAFYSCTCCRVVSGVSAHVEAVAEVVLLALLFLAILLASFSGWRSFLWCRRCVGGRGPFEEVVWPETWWRGNCGGHGLACINCVRVACGGRIVVGPGIFLPLGSPGRDGFATLLQGLHYHGRRRFGVSASGSSGRRSLVFFLFCTPTAPAIVVVIVARTVCTLCSFPTFLDFHLARIGHNEAVH